MEIDNRPAPPGADAVGAVAAVRGRPRAGHPPGAAADRPRPRALRHVRRLDGAGQASTVASIAFERVVPVSDLRVGDVITYHAARRRGRRRRWSPTGSSSIGAGRDPHPGRRRAAARPVGAAPATRRRCRGSSSRSRGSAGPTCSLFRPAGSGLLRGRRPRPLLVAADARGAAIRRRARPAPRSPRSAALATETQRTKQCGRHPERHVVGPMLAPMAQRVLVVEDEEDIAFPLVRTLEREGYDVEWVESGQKALDSSGDDAGARDPRPRAARTSTASRSVGEPARPATRARS